MGKKFFTIFFTILFVFSFLPTNATTIIQTTKKTKTSISNQETQTSEVEDNNNIKINKKSSGLKEVLNIGIKKAIELAGTKDGFYLNEFIKIPLPKKLKKIDSIIRKLGGKNISEKLVIKLNRAAENAVPLALDIFVNAIKNIKFTDVFKLFNGNKHGITEFLESSTSNSLKTAFYPIIKNSMEEVKAIKTYNDFITKHKSNPLASFFDLDIDINQYVTEKAVSGLFILIKKEEEKIRIDPLARTSDLLKALFKK